MKTKLFTFIIKTTCPYSPVFTVGAADMPSAYDAALKYIDEEDKIILVKAMMHDEYHIEYMGS